MTGKKKPEVVVKPAQMATHKPDAEVMPEQKVSVRVTAFLLDGRRFNVPQDGSLAGARVAAEEVFRKQYLELGSGQGSDYYPVSTIQKIEVRLG